MQDSGNLHFRIASIRQETGSARTYTLELLEDFVISWLPGQFLTFLLDIGGKEFRRSYSIVSLPGEPVRVTIKRVENGAVSRYVLMHWKEGEVVVSLPPAGRFTLQPQHNQPRDLFFIVAGSGITPALPQIRYLLDMEPQSTIHLVYSNHSEKETLFYEQVRALSQRYAQLQLHWFFSEPAAHPEARRRLNNGVLETLVSQQLRFAAKDAVFMLCGPFTFMRMARITLIFMHFMEEQIRRENFLPEIMRSGSYTSHVFTDQYITLQLKSGPVRLLVKGNQSILRAALEQHILLPYSCEGGVCSTCALRCTQGKVTMTINEVLSDKDLQEGWVLTCTGHPLDENVTLLLDRMG